MGKPIEAEEYHMTIAHELGKKAWSFNQPMKLTVIEDPLQNSNILWNELPEVGSNTITNIPGKASQSQPPQVPQIVLLNKTNADGHTNTVISKPKAVVPSTSNQTHTLGGRIFIKVLNESTLSQTTSLSPLRLPRPTELNPQKGHAEFPLKWHHNATDPGASEMRRSVPPKMSAVGITKYGKGYRSILNQQRFQEKSLPRGQTKGTILGSVKSFPKRTLRNFIGKENPEKLCFCGQQRYDRGRGRHNSKVAVMSNLIMSKSAKKIVSIFQQIKSLRTLLKS
ncbi:hypothetical protein RRG08_061093 [Elysia crispata]|uniref:Uncharacterized protein n=1 Tax=Elysia crispata TaxID=231223 RepID=A0AAE0ZQ22_9GAST|nr:hypothetical protein RRG08_061093 [Elysia crispata]